MQDPSPAPRPTPAPVSPGALLLRQFVTLILLMISLAISFAFLFVQQVPTNTDRHSTLVVIWGGVRPDMIADAITPHLTTLAQNGVVGVDQHANTSFVTAGANPPQTPTPGVTSTPTVAATQTPTGGATPTPGATGTVTPVATVPPTVVPTSSPVANVPLTDAGTLANLAQAALAKGSSISYEGTGGGALLSALPDPTNHAFILDDATTYPTSLVSQLQGQGVTPPGTLAPPDASHAPDVARISAFTQAYLRVILPQLKATSTPFLSIIREPEPVTAATLGGIGSAGFTAALRANDDALGDLVNGLSDAGLGGQVNIIVTSDHGIADVVPPDQTSAAQVAYTAPNAALRTDLAQQLSTLAQAGPTGPLPDVGKGGVARGASATTKATSVVVTAQGGNDALTFAPSALVVKAGQGDAVQGKKVVAQEVVRALQRLPQVGPIFVNDAALTVPDGALPLSQLGPLGAASPDVLVGFVTFARDVGQRGVNTALLAGSEYADTDGIAAWGAFGRRDLHGLLYLSGPNFKGGGNYSDLAPTSFTDLAPTIETIMSLNAPAGQGGRVITEALATDPATTTPAPPTITVASARVTTATGDSYVQVLVFEHFVGYSYVHAAYALHAQGAVNLDDLVTQATALANQE